MHLPGPFRAAVGLVASAAEEAKHLPDRAIELPMLAVSSVLQMSLRAQQRYARLAARGDQVLNRTRVSDDPPQWATFDEPVPVDELRRTALAQLDGLAGDRATSRLFEELFGVDSPGETGGQVTPEPADDTTPDNVTPIAKAKGSVTKPRSKAQPAKQTTPVKKTAPITGATPAKRTTPAKKAAPATKAAPAKKSSSTMEAASTSTSSTSKLPTTRKAAPARGKTVNKPRHTAPSKFDDVDDG
ncbi:MAG: hypothetical protein ABI345_11250 [Jatrophihabitans sp.]